MVRKRLFSPDKAATLPQAPEELNTVLGTLGEYAGGTVGTIADTLDFAGNRVRSALVGEPGQFDRTVSGRDVLRHYGLADDEDDWVDFIGGLAVEVGTDPLTYLTGGLGALGKAGKVAKATGIADDAARAASRKYLAGKATGEVADVAAKRSKAFTKKMGREVTDLDLYAQPVVGRRVATRNTTLQDLVDYADNPLAENSRIPQGSKLTERKLRDKAAEFGFDFDEIKDMPLGDQFGLATPLGDAFATFNLPGGGALGRGLDAALDGLRHSKVGRVAQAGFDKRAGNAFDQETQNLNIAAAKQRDQVQKLVGSEAEKQKAKLFLGAEDAFSAEGNRAIGRMIEGNATAADMQMRNNNKSVDEFVSWWEKERDLIPEESKMLGLSGAELDHEHGLKYLPYELDQTIANQMPKDGGKRGTVGQPILSSSEGSQMQRSMATQVMGGRDQLIELSQDPRFVGEGRSITSDNDVWEVLAQEAHGQSYKAMTDEGREGVRKLATFLRKLDPEYMKTNPLFGQHPTHLIKRYFEKRFGAMSDADTMMKYLADRVVDKTGPTSRTTRSVPQVLQELSINTGESKDLLRKRIADKMGVDPDTVNLSNLTVDSDDVARLTQVDKVFTNPAASDEAVAFLDGSTEIWKRAILAFPSRYVRDVYSGMFSNWLSGIDGVDGYHAAYSLMKKGPKDEGFRDFLRGVKKYQGFADDDSMVAQFYADMDESGLFRGRQALDRTTAVTGDNEALASMVGADKTGLVKSLSPLAEASGYKPSNFFSARTKKRPMARDANPILKTGDALNDLTDGINRLSGYLNGLNKGFDNIASGKMATRAQIDYNSLSDFERKYLRGKFFPWYSYSSRSFKEVLRQLAERPGGRYGQTLRAIDYGVRERPDYMPYMPEYLQQQVTMPVSQNEDGSVTTIGDFDVFGMDQLYYPDGFRTFENIGQQLNPYMRIGAEMASGRDFRYGTPLAQGGRGLASRAMEGMGMTSGYMGSILDRAIDLIPGGARIQRPIADLIKDSDRPIDERLAQQFIKILSGIKINTVEERQMLNDAIRMIEERIQPNIDSMEIKYLKKDMEHPEEVQRLFDTRKQLQSRSKKLRELQQQSG